MPSPEAPGSLRSRAALVAAVAGPADVLLLHVLGRAVGRAARANRALHPEAVMCPVGVLRQLLVAHPVLDLLPIRVAGPGGAYLVIHAYLWDNALWLEVDRDYGWVPPTQRKGVK